MEIPRHWRLKAQRYRMEGSPCPSCGRIIFPPRPLCPDCAAQPERAHLSDTLSLASLPATRLELPIGYRLTERATR